MEKVAKGLFLGYPCLAMIIIVSKCHTAPVSCEDVFTVIIIKLNALLKCLHCHHHHHLDHDHAKIPYNARGVSSLALCIQGCWQTTRCANLGSWSSLMSWNICQYFNKHILKLSWHINIIHKWNDSPLSCNNKIVHQICFP